MKITKRSREAAARYLSGAKELMNNGGRHWMQGEWRGSKDDETAYCLMGGIEAMSRLKHGGADPQRYTKPAYCAAVEALAHTAKPRQAADVEKHYGEGGVYTTGFYATTPGYGPAWLHRRRIESFENIVMSYNDARGRRWDQIAAKLEAAAERVIG